MNILLISDPHITVPPGYYGGAERVVHLYAQAFARLGHTVHLLAAKGSRSYGGRLHTHCPAGPTLFERAHRKILFQLTSLWASRDCNVVYNHGRSDYLGSLLRFGKPLLHRFPNPISQREVDAIERQSCGKTAFHCISENQRSSVRFGLSSAVIPNPVDCQFYEFGTEPGRYLLFLGRLTHNKGVDVAIKVAKQAKKQLVIAGNISAEKGGLEFFLEHVKPHLDDVRIRWVGPVNDSQKKDLLANAEALLFPIRWEEPFGIVMVESLACGTPVIATNRASCPEVVVNGSTGFLCSPAEPDVQAFVDAVFRLPQLSRDDCRNSAESRFDVRVVAPMVLDLLEQLANVTFR